MIKWADTGEQIFYEGKILPRKSESDTAEDIAGIHQRVVEIVEDSPRQGAVETKEELPDDTGWRS